jgi:hypothetical protein
MTLRNRQRAYLYDKLDRFFPGLRLRYEKSFGKRHSAPVQNATRLGKVFRDVCQQYGIAIKIPVFIPHKRFRKDTNQMKLF